MLKTYREAGRSAAVSGTRRTFGSLPYHCQRVHRLHRELADLQLGMYILKFSCTYGRGEHDERGYHNSHVGTWGRHAGNWLRIVAALGKLVVWYTCFPPSSCTLSTTEDEFHLLEGRRVLPARLKCAIPHRDPQVARRQDGKQHQSEVTRDVSNCSGDAAPRSRSRGPQL
ncbi:hypothetical protein BD626DRAFT_14637 [Schizophyllum amplum]|uniref:Uncharacterized protein n=1 Tax=Schizophyllum amplum TaxID=97359 RepID=A0A550CXQ4_9AGAR|nr:hypothetical protein BD626DRAFT_14637 [Auriculariopsis ampla]